MAGFPRDQEPAGGTRCRKACRGGWELPLITKAMGSRGRGGDHTDDMAGRRSTACRRQKEVQAVSGRLRGESEFSWVQCVTAVAHGPVTWSPVCV